jgi:hypothetical protein
VSKNRATKSATFTRPANTAQYATNDLVANHATAGSVVIPYVVAARFPGGNGAIKAVQLSKSTETLTAAAFRVHFFTAAPAVVNGDNGAFDLTNGQAKGYIGKADVTMDQALGDAAFGRVACDLQFDTVAPSAEIYMLLEATGTYTPASAESFTIELELERD